MKLLVGKYGMNITQPFLFLLQVISALAVSFGPFAVGLGKGYTSPALASLLPDANGVYSSDEQIPPFSPHLPNIKITEQQGSWIASLSLLGALFGGLCSGLIIKHGRRKTLIFVSIPLSISWAFTLFAYCVEMIYATAFIAGFCSAIIQVCLLKPCANLKERAGENNPLG